MTDYAKLSSTIKELYHLLTGRDDMAVTVDQIIVLANTGKLADLATRVKTSSKSEYGERVSHRLGVLEDPMTAKAVASFAANLERALRQPIYDSRSRDGGENTRPPWSMNDVAGMVIRIVPEVVGRILSIDSTTEARRTQSREK